MQPRLDEIELRALSLRYELRYHQANLPPGRITFVAPATGVALYIQCRDPASPPRAAVEAALREWLRAKAKTHLPKLLNQLADDAEIPRPTSCRIAFQRTRWGSRSTSGVISLSAALLFLPPELLRHVLLHELCHIRHMDHGLAFQTLLKRLDPATPLRAPQLAKAGAYVPEWL